MNKFIKTILILLFVFAATCVQAQMSEESKIEYLINSIGNVPDGTSFVRNGKKHDPEAAANHMRTKYNRGKRYAQTAVDFIENIASKSSISGREYLIEFSDGKIITAKEFFMNNLKKLKNESNGFI